MSLDLTKRNELLDSYFKGKCDYGESRRYYEWKYPVVVNLICFHWLDYLTLGNSINPHKGEAILELGSGYPLHLIYSRKVGSSGRYIGLDNNEKITNDSNHILQNLGLNDHIYHSAGDAFNLDCPKELFDKVVAVNLWTGEMHWPPKKEFYGRVYDTLVEGGSYYEKFFGWGRDEDADSVYQKLSSCGFDDISQRIVLGGFPFKHWMIEAKK